MMIMKVQQGNTALVRGGDYCDKRWIHMMGGAALSLSLER